MSDIVQTRLNGTIYSATSCSWFIAGTPYIGILDFNISQKRETKLVYAGRRDGTPLGMPSGKYSVDGLSMKMLTSSYQILIAQLSVLGLGSYGDAEFPIVATYSEPRAQVQGVQPIVIDISGARITSEKDSRSEGIDESVTEIEMMALSATRNGLKLYSLVNGIGQ